FADQDTTSFSCQLFYLLSDFFPVPAATDCLILCQDLNLSRLAFLFPCTEQLCSGFQCSYKSLFRICMEQDLFLFFPRNSRRIFCFHHLIFYFIQGNRHSGLAGHVDASIPGALYCKNISFLVLHRPVIHFIDNSNFVIYFRFHRKLSPSSVLLIFLCLPLKPDRTPGFSGSPYCE